MIQQCDDCTWHGHRRTKGRIGLDIGDGMNGRVDDAPWVLYSLHSVMNVPSHFSRASDGIPHPCLELVMGSPTLL